MHLRAFVDYTSLIQSPGDQVASATICIDQYCNTVHRTSAVPISGAGVNAPYDREQAVTVTVSLRDAAGKMLASGTEHTRTHRFQPNGPGCEPTCFQVSLRFDQAGVLTLVTPA